MNETKEIRAMDDHSMQEMRLQAKGIDLTRDDWNLDELNDRLSDRFTPQELYRSGDDVHLRDKGDSRVVAVLPRSIVGKQQKTKPKSKKSGIEI